jgi:heme A synthase
MRTQLQHKEAEERRLGRIIGWFAAIALVLLLLVLVVGSVVAKRAAQSGTWPKPLSSTVVN